MAGKPIKVAFLADTADLRSSLAKAEQAMDSAANEAKSAGQKIESSFDSAGQAADGVASTSAQVAGGLGDLGGALEATGFISEGTANAMNTASAAIMGVTGVSDLANAAFEKLKLGTLASNAATYAKAAADKVAAAGQWALNAAMAANPIALVVIALVALVAGLVIAYQKSETFREIVDKAFAKVKEIIENVAKFITVEVPKAFQAIMDKATAAKTWVTGKFGELLDFVGGLKDKITNKAGDLFKVVEDKITAANVWVGNKILALLELVGGVKDRITNRAGDLFGVIKDKIEDAKTAVGEKIGNLLETIGGLKDKITARAGDLFAGFREAFRGAVNSIIGMWNNLEFSIPAISIAGKEVFPGVSFGTPNIPYLADGGIVTRPTLAVIGEAGPEAVIPLDGRFGGIGQVRIVLTAQQLSQLQRGREVQADLDFFRSNGGRSHA